MNIINFLNYGIRYMYNINLDSLYFHYKINEIDSRFYFLKWSMEQRENIMLKVS